MRAWRPQDVLWLREAQTGGAWLEAEDRLLVGRSALRQALSTLWPLAGERVEAVVGGPDAKGARCTFVLARRRTPASEADLVFVAPGLGAGNGASLAWSRLISETGHWLARRGVERIYAAVDEDDRLALQVLRQIGFVVYTNDVVFVLGPRSDTGSDGVAKRDGREKPQGTEIPLEGVAAYSARQLAHAELPIGVRRHLPSMGGDWESYPLGGAAAAGRARVDGTGAVVGAWRVVIGRHGAWLRAVAGSDVHVSALLAGAIAFAEQDRRVRGKPVCSSARGYEPELNIALREAGFVAEARRFRLVKHTTARVLAPAWADTEMREAALGARPTSARLLRSQRPREPGS